MLPGVIATLSNDAEFFPGLKKSWAYTFMVNDEEAPTGAYGRGTAAEFALAAAGTSARSSTLSLSLEGPAALK